MFEKQVRLELEKAGVEVNGSRPWDIEVRDKRFYPWLALTRGYGLGHCYVEGYFDCQELDTCVRKLVMAGLEEGFNLAVPVSRFINKVWKAGSVDQARKNGENHYSFGNDWYEAVLGPSMAYSCGYFKGRAFSLEQAQQDKFRLICDKLCIKPGQSLLEIGCGWGSLLKYQVERYRGSVKALGISNSPEQVRYIEERALDLPGVIVKKSDYRDITGKFDRVVSIGMVEHVEEGYYGKFFQTIYNSLNLAGLALVHGIGKNEPGYTDPFIRHHIFQGQVCVDSIILSEASKAGLYPLDWHEWQGVDYARTLRHWNHNLNRHWPELKKKYSKRSQRLYNYYFLACAGAFLAESMAVRQVVYCRKEDSMLWNYYQRVR